MLFCLGFFCSWCDSSISVVVNLLTVETGLCCIPPKGLCLTILTSLLASSPPTVGDLCYSWIKVERMIHSAGFVEMESFALSPSTEFFTCPLPSSHTSCCGCCYNSQQAFSWYVCRALFDVECVHSSVCSLLQGVKWMIG